MFKEKLKHRHAVFLPLFLLCMVVSSLPSSSQTKTAMLLTYSGGERGTPFGLPDGEYGYLEPGAELSIEDGTVLTNGSVLLHGDAVFSVQVGDFSVSGVDGALHIVRGDRSLTVSALTSPALVSVQDGLVLIPVGYKWQHALEQAELPSLDDGYQAWSNARSFTLLPEHFARQALSRLVQLEPATNQDTSLQDPMTFLSDALPDQTLWMLASLHPQYREEAWTFGDDGYSPEASLVRLLAFPYVDGSSDSVSAYTFSLWVKSVRAAALRIELPLKLLERLYSVHAPLVSQMQQRGYPERADTLAKALRDMFRGYEALLPQELLQSLQALQPGKTDLALQRDDALEEAQAEQKPEPVLSESEVRSRTYEMLRTSNGLFTVETTVNIEKNDARIEHVLFSGSKKDRMLSFTFHALTETVSSVEADGKTYPFSMQLADFLQWLQS